jgi:hypothetical protein
MRKIGIALGMLWLASCEMKGLKEPLKEQPSLEIKNHDEKKAEPVIKEFDFGRMKPGDSIEYVFQLRNTGSGPVIIEDVKASCGCTTIDWIKTPIACGQTGWIKSRLKATDKGRVRKSVVAQLNTRDPFVVFYLTGEISSLESGSGK